MTSLAMTPGAEDTSQASASRLPTSTPSSPPSDGSPNGDKQSRNEPLGVSDAMLAEEKAMEDAALEEEKERQKKLQAQRDEDLKAVDPKFKRLEFLLQQSKVRATDFSLTDG